MACTYESGAKTLTVSGTIDDTTTDALLEAIRNCSANYTEDLAIDLSRRGLPGQRRCWALAVVMNKADQHGHSIELAVSQGSISERVLTIVGLPHSVA